MMALLFGLELAYAGLPVIKDWEHLQSEPLVVRCAADGSPWCESFYTVSCSIETLEEMLKDFSQYSDTFPRVMSAVELDSNIVHIKVDMPFPLYPRDYISHFQREEISGGIRFIWTSVPHPKAPETEDIVRLPNSAGSWTLLAVNDSSTKIEYFWNSEIGFDIPDWALPKARRTQGQEVMFWLQQACDRKK